MRARTRWGTALGAVQVAALVGTFPLPGLGTRSWHHVASLAATLLLAWAVRRRLHSRRILGLGVLATTILATASGFYLLYWKEGIRLDGYQDWGVFWHVAWSWAAAVFVFQHTWVNRVAYMHFVRRSLRSAGRVVVQGGLYIAAVAGLVLSVVRRAWFTNENYIPLTLWAWLVVTATAYAAWLALRRRDHAAQRRLRAVVDVALVPVAAAAVVSGLPLLFVGAWLDAQGLQYPSKLWHVVPSILFAVLVFVHSGQLWSALRNHWERVELPEPRQTG